MSSRVLVTGGAGYIGSHMCRLLAGEGFDVTVFDNLSTGHRAAVQWGALVEGDLREPDDIDAAIGGGDFEAVFHFGACSQVGESVKDPGKYYRNNVNGSVNLLQAMRRHGVSRIVFSSTAAVYGNPEIVPIPETHRVEPINPYGASKLMIERVLADFASAHGIASASLRYFNAAGASDDASIGEAHDPETHLIPRVLDAIVAGRAVGVFGDDYDTPDGTCIRDYIHVDDLCSAHLLALDHLQRTQESITLNLGTGHGYSVREVIGAAAAVAGRDANVAIEPRRAGDPAVLVARADRAREVLGWRAQKSDLESMIASVWRWEKKRRGLDVATSAS